MTMPPATTDCTYHEVCSTDDLWDGEMEMFAVGACNVLLIKHDGKFLAYQASCPHQGIPLVEGTLEKGVLTCRGHLWEFDVATGCGINPANCELKRYPVEVRDGMICVGETLFSA
jgi:nitrite reductase/ring-hydroxylating ferredoxin subunit